MPQNNPIIDAFIWFMTNYPIFGITTLAAILIAVFTIIGVYLFAFYQGREIILWGLRVGPKKEHLSDLSENSINQAESLLKNIDKDIINEIHNLLNQWDKDIEWFFDQVTNKSSDGELNSLISFIRDCRQKFARGQVGDTRMYYPWDCTISIMDLDGKCIDHDYEQIVN